MKGNMTIRNVDVFYGGFQALKNIELDIHAKQVTAFIGPSGCGKSTLLKTLNRMNDYVQDAKVTGQVYLDDLDVYSKETDIMRLRKQVGMVFQSPNPFPMSIYDNIAFGPQLFGIKKKTELDEIVEGSLRSAALWDEVKDSLRKSALQLSGGQQQRLCIARALSTEPKILLMDEPTSALDPISTNKIEELLYTLKESYTIAIVTHNMLQAARVSDQTAFFYQGEIVEWNQTHEIFNRPSKKQTEDYITGRFG